MSTPIDIYTYPENAKPIQLAEYQLEVMRAAERGEAMVNADGQAMPLSTLIGTFHLQKCRIARPKIAEGHNPDGLTEVIVGVRDGWRLLTVDEREQRERLEYDDQPSGIEVWGAGVWLEAWGNSPSNTYRTKNPPGHYLPKPAPAKPVKFRVLRVGEIAQIGDEYTACGDSVDMPPHNEPSSGGWIPIVDAGVDHGEAGHVVTEGDGKQGCVYRRRIESATQPAPEPVADPRNETRRDRIATIVQLIWNRSETAEQIAAHVEALLAREQTAPGLTFTDARNIVGQ